MTPNEKQRLTFELQIPFMKEDKESIFDFLNFLRMQKCFFILDREPPKPNEKLKKYPKSLVLNPRARNLAPDDKPRFISFLGRRKKWPIKATLILSAGKWTNPSSPVRADARLAHDCAQNRVLRVSVHCVVVLRSAHHADFGVFVPEGFWTEFLDFPRHDE